MIFRDRKTSCSKYHFGNQFMVNYDLSNNYFMPSVSPWNAQGNKYSQKYIQNVSKSVMWSVDADRIPERPTLACLDADRWTGLGGGSHNSSAAGLSRVFQHHPAKTDDIHQSGLFASKAGGGRGRGELWSLQYLTEKFVKNISFSHMQKKP